jgi:hypothetical protein
VHEPDPIAAWQATSKQQQKLIDWLADKEEVRLERQGGQGDGALFARDGEFQI